MNISSLDLHAAIVSLDESYFFSIYEQLTAAELPESTMLVDWSKRSGLAHTPLYLAVRHNFIPAIQPLIDLFPSTLNRALYTDSCPKLRQSALSKAIVDGHDEVAKILVENGASIDLYDINDTFLLEEHNQYVLFPLLACILINNKAMLSWLTEPQQPLISSSSIPQPDNFTTPTPIQPLSKQDKPVLKSKRTFGDLNNPFFPTTLAHVAALIGGLDFLSYVFSLNNPSPTPAQPTTPHYPYSPKSLKYPPPHQPAHPNALNIYGESTLCELIRSWFSPEAILTMIKTCTIDTLLIDSRHSSTSHQFTYPHHHSIIHQVRSQHGLNSDLTNSNTSALPFNPSIVNWVERQNLLLDFVVTRGGDLTQLCYSEITLDPLMPRSTHTNTSSISINKTTQQSMFHPFSYVDLPNQTRIGKTREFYHPEKVTEFPLRVPKFLPKQSPYAEFFTNIDPTHIIRQLHCYQGLDNIKQHLSVTPQWFQNVMSTFVTPYEQFKSQFKQAEGDKAKSTQSPLSSTSPTSSSTSPTTIDPILVEAFGKLSTVRFFSPITLWNDIVARFIHYSGVCQLFQFVTPYSIGKIVPRAIQQLVMKNLETTVNPMHQAVDFQGDEAINLLLLQTHFSATDLFYFIILTNSYQLFPLLLYCIDVDYIPHQHPPVGLFHTVQTSAKKMPLMKRLLSNFKKRKGESDIVDFTPQQHRLQRKQVETVPPLRTQHRTSHQFIYNAPLIFPDPQTLPPSQPQQPQQQTNERAQDRGHDYTLPSDITDPTPTLTLPFFQATRYQRWFPGDLTTLNLMLHQWKKTLTYPFPHQLFLSLAPRNPLFNQHDFKLMFQWCLRKIRRYTHSGLWDNYNLYILYTCLFSGNWYGLYSLLLCAPMWVFSWLTRLNDNSFRIITRCYHHWCRTFAFVSVYTAQPLGLLVLDALSTSPEPAQISSQPDSKSIPHHNNTDLTFTHLLSPTQRVIDLFQNGILLPFLTSNDHKKHTNLFVNHFYNLTSAQLQFYSDPSQSPLNKQSAINRHHNPAKQMKKVNLKLKQLIEVQTNKDEDYYHKYHTRTLAYLYNIKQLAGISLFDPYANEIATLQSFLFSPSLSTPQSTSALQHSILPQLRYIDERNHGTPNLMEIPPVTRPTNKFEAFNTNTNTADLGNPTTPLSIQSNHCSDHSIFTINQSQQHSTILAFLDQKQSVIDQFFQTYGSTAYTIRAEDDKTTTHKITLRELSSLLSTFTINPSQHPSSSSNPSVPHSLPPLSPTDPKSLLLHMQFLFLPTTSTINPNLPYSTQLHASPLFSILLSEYLLPIILSDTEMIDAKSSLTHFNLTTSSTLLLTYLQSLNTRQTTSTASNGLQRNPFQTTLFILYQIRYTSLKTNNVQLQVFTDAAIAYCKQRNVEFIRGVLAKRAKRAENISSSDQRILTDMQPFTFATSEDGNEHSEDESDLDSVAEPTTQHGLFPHSLNISKCTPTSGTQPEPSTSTPLFNRTREQSLSTLHSHHEEPEDCNLDQNNAPTAPPQGNTATSSINQGDGAALSFSKDAHRSGTMALQSDARAPNIQTTTLKNDIEQYLVPSQDPGKLEVVTGLPITLPQSARNGQKLAKMSYTIDLDGNLVVSPETPTSHNRSNVPPSSLLGSTDFTNPLDDYAELLLPLPPPDSTPIEQYADYADKIVRAPVIATQFAQNSSPIQAQLIASHQNAGNQGQYSSLTSSPSDLSNFEMSQHRESLFSSSPSHPSMGLSLRDSFKSTNTRSSNHVTKQLLMLLFENKSYLLNNYSKSNATMFTMLKPMIRVWTFLSNLESFSKSSDELLQQHQLIRFLFQCNRVRLRINIPATIPLNDSYSANIIRVHRYLTQKSSKKLTSRSTVREPVEIPTILPYLHRNNLIENTFFLQDVLTSLFTSISSNNLYFTTRYYVQSFQYFQLLDIVQWIAIILALNDGPTIAMNTVSQEDQDRETRRKFFSSLAERFGKTSAKAVQEEGQEHAQAQILPHYSILPQSCQRENIQYPTTQQMLQFFNTQDSTSTIQQLDENFTILFHFLEQLHYVIYRGVYLSIASLATNVLPFLLAQWYEIAYLLELCDHIFLLSHANLLAPTASFASQPSAGTQPHQANGAMDPHMQAKTAAQLHTLLDAIPKDSLIDPYLFIEQLSLSNEFSGHTGPNRANRRYLTQHLHRYNFPTTYQQHTSLIRETNLSFTRQSKQVRVLASNSSAQQNQQSLLRTNPQQKDFSHLACVISTPPSVPVTNRMKIYSAIPTMQQLRTLNTTKLPSQTSGALPDPITLLLHFSTPLHLFKLIYPSPAVFEHLLTRAQYIQLLSIYLSTASVNPVPLQTSISNHASQTTLGIYEAISQASVSTSSSQQLNKQQRIAQPLSLLTTPGTQYHFMQAVTQHHSDQLRQESLMSKHEHNVRKSHQDRQNPVVVDQFDLINAQRVAKQLNTTPNSPQSTAPSQGPLDLSFYSYLSASNSIFEHISESTHYLAIDEVLHPSQNSSSHNTTTPTAPHVPPSAYFSQPYNHLWLTISPGITQHTPLTPFTTSISTNSTRILSIAHTILTSTWSRLAEQYGILTKTNYLAVPTIYERNPQRETHFRSGSQFTSSLPSQNDVECDDDDGIDAIDNILNQYNQHRGQQNSEQPQVDKTTSSSPATSLKFLESGDFVFDLYWYCHTHPNFLHNIIELLFSAPSLGASASILHPSHATSRPPQPFPVSVSIYQMLVQLYNYQYHRKLQLIDFFNHDEDIFFFFLCGNQFDQTAFQENSFHYLLQEKQRQEALQLATLENLQTLDNSELNVYDPVHASDFGHAARKLFSKSTTSSGNGTVHDISDETDQFGRLLQYAEHQHINMLIARFAYIQFLYEQASTPYYSQSSTTSTLKPTPITVFFADIATNSSLLTNPRIVNVDMLTIHSHFMLLQHLLFGYAGPTSFPTIDSNPISSPHLRHQSHQEQLCWVVQNIRKTSLTNKTNKVQHFFASKRNYIEYNGTIDINAVANEGYSFISLLLQTYSFTPLTAPHRRNLQLLILALLNPQRFLPLLATPSQTLSPLTSPLLPNPHQFLGSLNLFIGYNYVPIHNLNVIPPSHPSVFQYFIHQHLLHLGRQSCLPKIDGDTNTPQKCPWYDSKTNTINPTHPTFLFSLFTEVYTLSTSSHLHLQRPKTRLLQSTESAGPDCSSEDINEYIPPTIEHLAPMAINTFARLTPSVVSSRDILLLNNPLAILLHHRCFGLLSLLAEQCPESFDVPQHSFYSIQQCFQTIYTNLEPPLESALSSQKSANTMLDSSDVLSDQDLLALFGLVSQKSDLAGFATESQQKVTLSEDQEKQKADLQHDGLIVPLFQDNSSVPVSDSNNSSPLSSPQLSHVGSTDKPLQQQQQSAETPRKPPTDFHSEPFTPLFQSSQQFTLPLQLKLSYDFVYLISVLLKLSRFKDVLWGTMYYFSFDDVLPLLRFLQQSFFPKLSRH